MHQNLESRKNDSMKSCDLLEDSWKRVSGQWSSYFPKLLSGRHFIIQGYCKIVTEVVWKCDRWPQTEESQLASQLQNCRAYWFNLAIMDHFCNAGDSNLAPTAGSAKISDSKKISGVEENLKVLTSKTKAAWERIGGWFVTHQEPGGCDCLRRSSNQPALYLRKSRNWVRPRSLHWWANSTS